MKNYVTLNNGIKQPVLGLGTWQMVGAKCFDAVSQALKIGYRHIDTADIYGNHTEISEALKETLEVTDITRKDIFLTSKLWRTDLGAHDVYTAFEKIMSELKVEYLDQLLIHWPNKNTPLIDTLSAMQDLYAQGLVRSIGVSNFTQRHLEDIDSLDIKIQVNQVELHPTFNQHELVEYSNDHGLQTVSYSPLGRSDDLKHETITKLAEKYQKPASQVILNWHIQKNLIAIPKASSIKHLQSNFDTLSWSLEEEDIKLIDTIKQSQRMLQPSFHEFNY
jgi:diketogulonate reductase-like aldo/keto reductase